MSVEERAPITPQQYEVLHGGGAEAAEIAKQRLSRRRFLRRSMLAVWGLSTTAAIAGALDFLYPTLGGSFGSAQVVGKKGDFPAALPLDFAIDIKGIFHKPVARTYVVHLAKNTTYSIADPQLLKNQQESEFWTTDTTDGTQWLALYQRCVHLGCTVPFRDDCSSFKCPCHGSHYNVDGEFLDGPAPRSLDRFQIHFDDGGNVIVETGVLNQTVPHPDTSTRIIPVPLKACGAGG
ncbi:MAG TPA: ubiquinol-cytochrome c reductase iron-sulfur subunit [Ktedonobacteraceae bacterium]|jgi:cytochrome b6-f complex iron-sulfur subunit